VANHDSRFADVDCEAPDRSRHPRFAGAWVYDVVLSPGELLFVPVGWWHQVRALEPSISIALTGFVFASHHEWDTDMAR
jgi:ribosomal protein L16 Arg81 hydroxylase